MFDIHYIMFVLLYLYFWFSQLVEKIDIFHIQFQPFLITFKIYVVMAIVSAVLTVAYIAANGLRKHAVYRGFWDLFMTYSMVIMFMLAAAISWIFTRSASGLSEEDPNRLHLMMVSICVFLTSCVAIFAFKMNIYHT